MSDLLQSYPRQRPPLGPEYQAVFLEEYRANREGTGAILAMVKNLESWMHRRVASMSGGRCLELGAGTLNHVPYEPKAEEYDVVEPMTALLDGSAFRSRVRDAYLSVADVPAERRYDRVLSIAALEHMVDLPHDVAQATRRLEPEGVFQAAIPSEGGFLWGFSWRTTTGVGYWLRHRLNYAAVMRHEHINTAPEILSVVRYFYGDVRLRRFPTPIHHLSFYTYIEARVPRYERVETYFRDREAGAAS